MRTHDARLTHLEGKQRAAAQAQAADSGAKEMLLARLENLRARMTPEYRALALAHPERVSPAEALVAGWRRPC